MSIPAKITTALADLQAQVTAATPLAAASRQTIKALQLNATQLVQTVDASLIVAAGALDSWTAPTDPDVIVTGVLALLGDADDQSSLAIMRGYIGRSTANLNQL